MWLEIIQARYIPYYSKNQNVQVPYSFHLDLSRKKDKILLLQYHVAQTGLFLNIYTSGIYNPQIEMFARFKTKSSFHKTKRII